jgi:hypothetical protein
MAPMFDARELRRSLAAFATVVAIVTTTDGRSDQIIGVSRVKMPSEAQRYRGARQPVFLTASASMA